MATYSTDLTTLTTAESGTWVDFAAPYDSGNPGLSGENFIQGTDCYAVNTGKNNGLEISVVFDYGSNYTFGTDEVMFAWVFYAYGTNLETYANNGWRFGIGSSTSAWDWFRIGGSDYGRNPYGGWLNVAIDPTATETGTIGGGNSGNYRYFGNVPYTLAEVSKGDPVASDAIREGRGLLSVTGSGSSFSELAEYNDYNGGGTPPGTSSTSVDSGYHRLGLFQEQGGTYLWKGQLSFGTAATSVTFSDSNETIIIEDCPHTYADFNIIEIHNTSSSVTWTNITFISTATTTVALGYFEMIDNATTVDITGCSFNDMGTFTFLSNAVVDACVFNSCGQIDSGAGDFSNSSVLASTVATNLGAFEWDSATDPNTSTDGMTFSMGSNDHHAIDFGTSVTDDITLTNCEFTGFDTINNDANDSTVRFLATTGALTLNLVGCTVNGVDATTSNFTVHDTAGIDVTVAISVSINVTVVDKNNNGIVSVTLSIHNSADNSEILNSETDAFGQVSGSFSGTTPADVYVRARKSSGSGGVNYVPNSTTATITSSGLALTIVMQVDGINTT